jgi:hypothetical protein
MVSLRICPYIIALTVMVAGLSRAQAADETLTLACQGTTISDLENAKPEPVSMGIIVNFTAPSKASALLATGLSD